MATGLVVVEFTIRYDTIR